MRESCREVEVIRRFLGRKKRESLVQRSRRKEGFMTHLTQRANREIQVSYFGVNL